MIVLAVFLIAGNYLFNFFGITVPAFQIMGGVLFLTNALRTLVTEDRRAPGEKRMIDEDVEKAEVDPTSIGIPARPSRRREGAMLELARRLRVGDAENIR